MALEHYYRLLRVKPAATDEEVKNAFYRAAKHNHPDLHPEERRAVQQLAMMRINEAYLAIMCERTGHGSTDVRHESESEPDDPGAPTGEARTTGAAEQSARTDLGQLRDPAYAYYRRGFDAFRNGYSALFRRDPREMLKHLRESRTVDGYILKLTIRALQNFEQAYRYFHTVAHDYPDSIWAYDARWKLRRVETYSAVYHRICERLAENLSRAGETNARSG